MQGFTALIIDTEGKVRAERLLEIAVSMSPTTTPCNSNRSTTAAASHNTSENNNSKQGSPIMRRAKVMRSRSPVLSRTRRGEQQSPEYVCGGIGERRQSSVTIDDGVRTRLTSPEINPGIQGMADVRLSPEARGMGEKQQSPDNDVGEQGPESDDRAESRQDSPNPSDCLEGRKQNPDSRERVTSRQQSPDIMEGVTMVQQSPDSLERVLVRQCRDVESLAALVELLPLLVKAAAPTVRGIFIDSLAQPFRQGKGVHS
jgi:hypothetical protein